MTKHLIPPVSRRQGQVSRRQFVQASGAVALGLGSARSAQAAVALEAYASATSVKQGGTLNFCVRDPVGSLTADTNATVTIVRIAGWVDLTLLNASFKVRNRSVPATASSTGCGWPSSYTLTVPSTWRSGLYYAFFQGVAGSGCCVPFVVRAAVKTPAAKVLVQVPVTTAQALNNYGGKSLFDYNSSASLAAAKVSFDRPFTDRWNFAFDGWQAAFVRWLEKSGFQADFCTNIDLHREPGLANAYSLLAIAGNDAYWTREMRTAFDAFVTAGGNAALLGASTCQWQARLEANAAGTAHRTLVCYRSNTADPDPRPAYKTNQWSKLDQPEPENRSVGLSSRVNSTSYYNNTGASWTSSTPRPATPYVVKVDHWIFEGTGLKGGDTFGADLSGYLMDAAAAEPARVPWNIPGDFVQDSRPLPTGQDGSPETMTILAVADARFWYAIAAQQGDTGGAVSGVGNMAIFSRGGSQGAVFNAGTTDWANSLLPELAGQTPTPVSRITRNIVTRLSAAHKESAEVRRYLLDYGYLDQYELCIGSHQTLNLPPYPAAFEFVESFAFRGYAVPTTGTVPVYRFKYTGQYLGDTLRYYYSLRSAVGNGWVSDGIAFHAFATVRPNTVPVYQHHRVSEGSPGWLYYFSTRLVEPGWIFDDLAFYTPVF